MPPTFKFLSLDTIRLSTIPLHYTLFITSRPTMQSLAEDYASDDAAFTTSNMSISSYSLSTASIPPLQYPQFGTTNHLELPNTSTLCFLKLEDNKAKDKDKPILSPAPFTAVSPAQIGIKIKIETDEPKLTFDELAGPNPISTPKNKNTATNNPVSNSTTLVLEEENPIDNWDLSDLSSRWDNNRDQEYKDTWLSPPQTSVDGDDMHPLSLDCCGDFPSDGWDFNEPLSSHYHRILIPSPVGKRQIVAPYVRYNLDHKCPEVSGTFGQGYKVHTHLLRPVPMDHLCPPLTLEQLQLLDSQAPFAFAITKVVDTYFPPNLATGVHQYQFYKDTQYVLQASVKSLEDKAQCYLEGAMEVLSELENANVLGRLLAHADIISTDLLAKDAQVYTHYARLVCSFHGDITYSTLDTRVNIHQMPQPSYILRSMGLIPYRCNEIPECAESCKIVSCPHPPDLWRKAIDDIIEAEAEEDGRTHASNCLSK